MKAKSLLLFGISACALSGCTIIKAHDHKVNFDSFKSSVNSAFQKSILYDIAKDKACSLQIDTKGYTYAKTSYLKDNKTIATEKLVNETSGKLKYDHSKNVVSIKGSLESESSDSSDEKEEEYSGSSLFQVNNNKLLEIDLNSKCYKVSDLHKEGVDPASLVWSVVKQKFSSLFYLIEIFGENIQSAKYYVDSNVYTIEIDTSENDKDTGTKRTGKDVYQIVTKDDGSIEFRTKSNMLVEKENYKFDTRSDGSFSITKRDVAVAKVDLNKYLDITEPEDDDSDLYWDNGLEKYTVQDYIESLMKDEHSCFGFLVLL